MYLVPGIWYTMMRYLVHYVLGISGIEDTLRMS
jgi:hypothetical protein